MKENKKKELNWPNKRVMEKITAFDRVMDGDRVKMSLSKAIYCTKFWEYLRGLDAEDQILKTDDVEVNKIKPALASYLANLYPREMKYSCGVSPYTSGDPQKAALLINDFMNSSSTRQKILSLSRMALLYKGAGAKVGYDPASEGYDRVWMRAIPYWEMMLDRDVHDLDDQRFIGHISYQLKAEIAEKYDIDPDDLSGTAKSDWLNS